MQLDYPMRQRLIHQIVNRTGKALEHNDESVRRAILVVVAEEFSGSRLTVQERKRVVDQLFHAMRGLDVLQPLMDNPQITEIMVNGPEKIFVEINGCLEPVDIKFHDREHLAGVITNFFGCANRLIHEKKPLADMRLANGARVHAALPPAAPDGPVLTIRKFTGIRPDMAALIDSDFISEEAAEDLIRAVRERKSIFICGGTGSGKTTLLNILSGFIPPQERVVTIEDAAELNLQGLDNLVRLEARQPGPDGDGAIDLTDLVRASLRLRPDRIIVGEVRGREAYDMLQAMNTGHPGSLCTGHGNSCQDMIDAWL
jgi:pilus assembly protein CpaF